MSKDMKLIMENWRKNTLNENLPSDPITWGQFGALLKTMAAARKGLTGDALVNAGGLTSFFGGGDAAEIASAIGGLVSEGHEPKTTLNELITVGAVLLGLKVLGGISTTVNAAKLIKKGYDKYKGKPTNVTDKAPFLDLLNMDPEYSKIIDDRIEDEFVEDWLRHVQGQAPDDEMTADDLDVNKRMKIFLARKFNNRTVKGHVAPGGLSTGSGVKTARRKARAGRVAKAAGKQIGLGE